MPKLQRLLLSCFGYAAIASTAVSITLLPVFLRSPLPHATSRFHAEPFQLLLIAMRELILLMPPVVAIVNGMAWWALKYGAPSARKWAISASVSALVLSAPFLVADFAIVRYSLSGLPEFTGVLVLFLMLFSLGVAGVVAFARRNSSSAVYQRVTSDVQGMGALAPTA